MKAPKRTDILRYWLQCIRYEEALTVRPKSWRSSGLAPEAVNLRDPTDGRLYFKLSLEDTAALLAPEPDALVLPMARETFEFFESWLARQYRRVDRADEGPEIMVTCPTAQLKFEELAGLLRFGVHLTFEHDDGEGFQVPTRRERKRGRLPSPPSRVRLERLAVAEGPPFYVDGRLLSKELGATGEEVEALFAKLAGKHTGANPTGDCLGVLAHELDGQSQEGTTVALLERLTEEMSRRLAESPSAGPAYPVAIAMDASRAKTTWHLQRELEKLIKSEGAVKERRVLHTYLSGVPARAGKEEVVGLFGQGALTPSQSEAAMRFLGSPFSAVEGPPGTGKTTLILHLAAHLLVDRIAGLAETGEMPRDLTVVTSTNNRAVDNVIDPLGVPPDGEGLPLAIRVGSRRVCEKILPPALAKTREWLDARARALSEQERKKRLQTELKRFTKRLDVLEARLAPARRRQEALEEQEGLERELEALEKEAQAFGHEVTFSVRSLKNAGAVLGRLEERLARLSVMCEGHPSKKRLKRVRGYFEREVARLLDKTSHALYRVDRDEVLFAEPENQGLGVEKTLARWEEAAEKALDVASKLRATLKDLLAQKKRYRQIKAVREERDALVVPPPAPVDKEAEDQMRRALFQQALAVRNAHAAAHAEAYGEAVARALRAAEDQASLRHFGRTKPDQLDLLVELFPVWGCTLLSLGNVLDDSYLSIDHAVIDEAGQCHPAYAVSALMRSKSAVVLGDVHQLTPIFGLTEGDERPIRKAVLGGDAAGVADLRIFDKSPSSVQALAEKAVAKTVRLTDHFRCQREIIEISDRLCDYGLTVHTPRRGLGHLVPLLDRPVLFVPIPGDQERQGGSWYNRAELQAVMGWLDGIMGAGIPPEAVAVITPYRGQLIHTRRALIARGLPVETSAELIEEEERPSERRDASGIAIGTVHRFQGGERSVVIFSTVVTDPRSLRFLNERVNLINVAVSRAKEHLVVIGHAPTLAQGRLTRLLVKGEGFTDK
jgi:hypothetical protein